MTARLITLAASTTTEQSVAMQRGPTTNDSWLTASAVLPVVLGVGLVFAGLNIGTVCTDTPGNGGLWESPCNRVDLGIKLGVGAEAVLGVIAVMLALRSRRTTWVTRTFVVLSIASFAVSLAIAMSY